MHETYLLDLLICISLTSLIVIPVLPESVLVNTRSWCVGYKLDLCLCPTLEIF